eukprot:gene5387-960_t
MQHIGGDMESHHANMYGDDKGLPEDPEYRSPGDFEAGRKYHPVQFAEEVQEYPESGQYPEPQDAGQGPMGAPMGQLELEQENQARPGGVSPAPPSPPPPPPPSTFQPTSTTLDESEAGATMCHSSVTAAATGHLCADAVRASLFTSPPNPTTAS